MGGPAGYPAREAMARWFDGQSARAQDIVLRLGERSLTIVSLDGRPEEHWPLGSIRALNERGDSVVQLVPSADSDARVLLDDEAMIVALGRACPNLFRRPKDHRGIRAALVWGAGAVGAVALVVFVLIPALSDQLALLIPPDREQALGESVAGQFRDVLAFMGGEDEAPAFCIEPEGMAALALMTERIDPHADLPYPLRIRVLDHGMENAFALPGGQIVLFRGLIEEARSAEEIAGVLAHEIGHVVHRDPTRGVLRSAGTAGILGLLVGDVFGASIAVAAGEAVVNASYQRDAETKADEVAYDLLDGADLPAGPFAGFFERMAEKHGDAEGAWRYFASHPGLLERAERAAAADRIGDGDFEPVLSKAEWTALRNVCDETEAEAAPQGDGE